MKRTVLFFVMLAVTPLLRAQIGEPDVEVAKAWWPEQYNVWTPLGWPDHYFKYAVLYNGTIIVSPAAPSSKKPHAKVWNGEDFQLTFCASEDGHGYPIPAAAVLLRDHDGGLGVQSWDPAHDTPVLRTEFRAKDGVVLETEVFAHVPEAAPVRTSLEPEFARIRVRVKYLESYYHPSTYKMSVLLSRIFFGHVDNMKLSPDIALFPGAHCDKALRCAPESFGTGCDGYRITQVADSLVRMDVLPGPEAEVSFAEVAPGLYKLLLSFPARVGAHADLIFPVLCQKREDADREAAISHEEALAQSDPYWASLRPATAATFEVPESYITDALAENFKLARVLAERDYVSGEYSYISGVWQYDAFWPTPGSMISAMFMDPMGYFADTERYSEVFLHNQGSSVAPGAAFRLHPGYFSSPRDLESVDWLTDHGAVMWQVATHALLTGDRAFIDHWTEPLLRACDFIKDYSLSEHPGIPGLLPAGWSTDEEVPVQSVWNLAWNYKGLSTVVRLLEKTGHPRAQEFSAFQQQFRQTFLQAYRKVVEDGPRWTDDQGRIRYRPPQELYTDGASRFQTDGRPMGHTFMTDAFYLDGGPLCLVWAGLMDADDPVMQDMLAFFREGPNWKIRKPFPWSLDRAVLDHEISSCEPCYSFNAFHSWQLGDREHYLEAMYSILVGSISQNTYISCEHRHGIQGTLFSFPLGICLARLAVIDEQIEPGALHLLRFCPLAWLKADRPARFLMMPTEFGPVDLTLQLSADGKTLDVGFSGEWRDRPGQIILHVPPVPGLKKVSVNGKKYHASAGEIILK